MNLNLRLLPVIVGVALLLASSLLENVSALHLQGIWNSTEFFVFLAKFGFQKTNPQKLEDTQGYIYGNITAVDELSTEELTLVVVDNEYFLHYYGNRTLPLSRACPVMFKKINTIAFDWVCNTQGKEDFLRAIPCPKGQLCSDEDNRSNVVSSYQFTFKVRDTLQPRFWYLSIVSCTRDRADKHCKWTHKQKPIAIHYDIWIVNGNPSSKGLNPFEHQFSFEFHDIFEIYLIAFLLMSLILFLWMYAFLKQKHPITKLLTVVFCGELLSNMLSLSHITVFAFNGKGVPWLSKVGTLVDLGVQCLFMMFLLLLAKGWAITTTELHWKSVIFTICGVYTVLNLFLYIWNLVEIDNIISNTDEWQTWPGYATLAFRLLVMVWFLVELRRTYSQGNHHVTFIQHFAAFFLVWFIYLPLLVLIGTQVSPLWRYKTILSINYAVDILAYVVMVHLFWPSRSVLFMVNGERPLPIYDLEITGLLEDMQETTLFTRESSMEELTKTRDQAGEFKKIHKVYRNGDLAKKEKTAKEALTQSHIPNRHTNKLFEDELLDDKDDINGT